MSARTPTKSASRNVREVLVKAESNLEDYPFFAIKSRNRELEPRTFERTTEGAEGVRLRQKWTVMPSTGYGMPGPLDQDVYLAVLELLERKGGMPHDGKLRFSLYELVRILGWSDSGKDGGKVYRDVRESLERIGATRVKSENAFFSRERDGYISDSFNVWSVHLVSDRPREGEERERHSLEFHGVFIRNFQAQYLKGLDAAFYWSLRSPLSRRLYRLIDQRRRGERTFREDLFTLRDQIPLANYRYASKIKEALDRAHGELKRRGFLFEVNYEGKVVRYAVSEEFVRRQKALELSGTPEEVFAIRRLMAEGLRGDVARALVARRGPEDCLRYADAVGGQKGVRNRAGWLRKAIEESYEIDFPTQQALIITEEEPPIDVSEQKNPMKRQPDPYPAAQEIWAGVLEDLAGGAEEPSPEVWFEGCVPVALKKGTLTLSVPTPLAEEYIERRFKEEIEKFLRIRLGEGAQLSLKSYG